MLNVSSPQTLQLALQHFRSGNLQQAQELYRLILRENPGHSDALYLLGVLENQQGHHQAAIDLIQKAIAANPAAANYLVNLGKLFQTMGRLDEAIAVYEKAITLGLRDADLYIRLGNALEDLGHLERAIASFQQASALKPDYPEAHNNLGSVCLQAGKIDQAIASFQKALKLRPQYLDALSNLGNALGQIGELDQALACHQAALALRPDATHAHLNMGNAYKNLGRLDEAIAMYRKAIALQPGDTAAHSNLVYIMHYHPDYDAAAIYQEHWRWNQVHAQPLAKTIQPHKNDPSPERRLKIGYVSPDFRGHIVGLALLPMFQKHNHQQFEVFCYADIAHPDATTEKLRSCADHWHSILGHSDQQVAQKIRDDQIDILFDLTLHMAKNRLPVFARKPAPVQVTYLGYPSTTGLTTMDYRLSDPYLDPSGTDQWYSEKTICLPQTHLCWQWNGAETQVNSLPASQAGYITFGSLNNFCKVTPGALDLWGQILSAVKNSRLILRCPAGSAAQNIRRHLGRHGITDDRLELVGHLPWEQYVALYHRHDIGLDPFPYTGHTTSCDSLWMGVPVITLAGQTAVSRGGLSILSNVGLQELVARTPAEYVKIATELAADMPRLAQLRSTLRQRMLDSPLLDAPRFARHIETAYRQMWRNWCKENSARPNTKSV